MDIYVIWLVFLSYQVVFGALNWKEGFEFYPERVHHTRHKRDLSTREEGINHESTATYKFKDHFIDLFKAENPHSGTINVRSYDDITGEAKHEDYKPEECHYFGKVRGMEDSHVHLSTCDDQLSGSVSNGEEVYSVEPVSVHGILHQVKDIAKELSDLSKELQKTKPVVQKEKDGDLKYGNYHQERYLNHDYDVDNSKQESFRKYQDRSNKRALKKDRKYQQSFNLYNLEPQYIPYLNDPTHVRYTELLVSTHKGIYESLGKDKKRVINKVLSALTQIDKTFSVINIRIVVVAIDVLTTEPWNRTVVRDFGAFGDHYRYLKTKTPFKNIRTDNAQFFSGLIGGGLAWQGAMCSLGAYAINGWRGGSLHAAFVMGHEFGHNLNMPHDYKGCKCLTSKGCVMGGWKTALNGFSDCSLRHMEQKKKWCLNDYPATNLNPSCGNGIKEGDEECDCGTEEMCRNKGDNCCKPYECTLKASSQCSHINNPDCCSKQCLFKSYGTLCRESSNNCDTPEYCTGESAQCPTDLFRQNGQYCGYEASSLNGPAWWTTKYIPFNPKVQARYVRIRPQFWSSGGKPCMRFQLFGCPINQDLTGLPTGFFNGPGKDRKCIQPVSDKCSNVDDGTKLKFQSSGPTYDCNHAHMLYKLQSNGVLIHECSGKKICSNNNNEIIISSQCSDAESTFSYFKKSYKQVSSGKCINTYLPADGSIVKLVDCSQIQHKLHLLTQECIINLVSKRPDESFTANSVHREDFAQNARMNSTKYWCGDMPNKNNYLQIDLGSEQSVNFMLMQTKWRNELYSFHLQYSVDKLHWSSYKTVGATEKSGHDYCYEGNCIRSHAYQCRDLWDREAEKGSEVCWNKNTVQNIFGTCSIDSNTPCSESNKYCGQLQCTSKRDRPFYVDYGANYTKHNNGGKTCSLAAIMGNEQRELGMVEDGTKCGDKKVCIRQKCKTFAGHGFKNCIQVNNSTCNNRGVCRNDGSCLCENNFNPADGCSTILSPINGAWSLWSSWSICDLSCGGGNISRFRICSSPKHGGKECVGNNREKKQCNTDSCPVRKSCKLIKKDLESKGKTAHDGVYRIEPRRGVIVQTYCDMTRNGGGWTLIVSSDTNQWTNKSVWLKNENNSSLRADFSILVYANDIKHNEMISDTTFQYRLEANEFNHWGGIWRAPSYYNISSETMMQADVQLQQKFDNWTSGEGAIVNRIPSVKSYCLTTSWNPLNKRRYGSITDIAPEAHPAYWINGHEKLADPIYIWYWLREGDFDIPKSCLEVKKRGRQLNQDFPTGVYRIKPSNGKNAVKTFCDMSRHGGGWTLAIKSKSRSGWTQENIGLRNENNPKSADFSILKFVDFIKKVQEGEDTFDYMVEADGDNQNGGIFSVNTTTSLMHPCQSDNSPKLIHKFGNWDSSLESIGRSVITVANTGNKNIFLKGYTNDFNGVIVSNGNVGKYMTTLQQPQWVKVWVREGGSRQSCNDIAVKGYHKEKASYKNGFYLLENSLLVYCDMERDPQQGWTLLVTSNSSGWTRDKVLSRNEDKPTLVDDYSILNHANKMKSLSNGATFKYMLEAFQRGHWGGIYEADIDYSFNMTQPDNPTKQLSQFDSWEPNSDWKGINSRMPWLGDPAHGRALLTTSRRDDHDESGTICADNPNGFLPARWIYPELRSPGTIWYWMNENDCDADMKIIDGKYSQWSEWSPCPSCNKGKQVRKRHCNDPVPRCGGRPCEKDIIIQERPCQESCGVPTRLKSPDSNYCLEPETGKCSPADKTNIMYRPVATHCQDNSSLFLYNKDTGKLVHYCSGIPVCAERLGHLGTVWLRKACINATYSIYRSFFGSLQFGDHYCNDPIGGKFPNRKMVLWPSCEVPRKKILFPEIGQASSVFMQTYKFPGIKTFTDLTTQQGYPSSTAGEGYLDVFASTPNIGDQYQARLTSYFIVPMTGDYRFYMVCDDMCQLNIGNVPGGEGRNNKTTLVTINGWMKGRFNFFQNGNQRSAKIFLKKGSKYLLEALLIEWGGGDFVSVGCIMPDETKLLPLTARYLTHRAN